jgi:hypothetical protein
MAVTVATPPPPQKDGRINCKFACRFNSEGHWRLPLVIVIIMRIMNVRGCTHTHNVMDHIEIFQSVQNSIK